MSDKVTQELLSHATKRKQTGKYGFDTKAEEIEPHVDLHGKNVIITGAFTGIGHETARVFATRGARVFVAGRGADRGAKIAEELKKSTNNPNIESLELDLSSLAAVRESANKFLALNIPLHYLVNNAGVMACPKGKTADGFETQIGVNHLGHFLFTNLLIPRLIQGAPSRVVVLSSSAHTVSSIRWDDINWEKGEYHEYLAYGQSKTANILFAVELNRRYKDQGVIANSLHPGFIQTELQRHLNEGVLAKVMAAPGTQDSTKYSMIPKTIPQGAATTLYAALSPDVSNGGYFCDDCEIATDPPAKDYALDPEAAKKLWTISEKLVGLSK
eukprot:Phypoly_transcript_11974.p1 GENE.Phypoly_transcript_11974~~Phypoly_transcript_11974.p1  ORF type:complete len:329 (+),score=54.45 Phypoly_transcript_11974:116-1102(+)